MKKGILLVLALLLAGCVQRPVCVRCTGRYEVLRVIDGDTFVVEDSSGIRTRIRLRNIDAPEKGEPGYEEAKGALERKILGKKIKLRAYAIDRYGRTIAELSPEP